MTPSLHTRETRDAAREVKFPIAPALADDIARWARTHLAADPYGVGPLHDEYALTTVYLDTPEYDVYHRQGSFGRSKYRVRRYDGAPEVFLERKMRTPAVLTKRRTLVPMDHLPRLTQSAIDRDWEGFWFRQRVAARRLVPAARVTYHRIARVGMNASGPIRLTIDRDVRATRAQAIAFDGDRGTPALPDRAILELKFRADLPVLFKQLVEEFNLTQAACSKYRLSLDALGGPQAAAASAFEEGWPA